MNKIHLWVVVLGLSGSVVSAADHHWDYATPDHWPGTCTAGQVQSPIDIVNPPARDLPPIMFDYKDSPLRLVDNGHTLQVNYASGSGITVGGKRYELVQFHFHHPSEEKVNGQSSDMVAHLVHKAADGSLAVVAVLLKKGDANPVIETVWSHWPANHTEQQVPGTAVNVSSLLPASRGYYNFPGSLTTPPCTEGITWFVLKTPVTLSEQQLARFAKTYPMNARPSQPLHGRPLQQTQN